MEEFKDEAFVNEEPEKEKFVVETPERTVTEENVQETEKPEACGCQPKRQKCIWTTIGFIVLFAAIIVLFCVVFSMKGGNKPQNAALQAKMESGEVPFMLTVNNDSIVARYVIVEILTNDLEEESARYQKELQSKQATFEEKYKNYQINVQNQVLTKTQMENAEVQLTNEAQALKALQEKYATILANKQASVQKEIADSIIAVTTRINDSRYHAKYVLATATGSAIVYNSPEYDITEEVIAELNATYEKNHKKNE